MSAQRFVRALTLAVHPTWAGFGWIAFETPLTPHGWSLVYTPEDKNAVCLRRLEKLLDRLDPGVLVLESSKRQGIRGDRIERLCRSIADLAASRNIEVAVFSRTDVQSTFAQVGARTRHEIAQAVARSIEGLRHRLPPPRKRWDKEDPRLALFSAAALGLTYFRLEASAMLEGLG